MVGGSVYLNINQRVKVDGDYYYVKGCIRYRNQRDQEEWTEYMLTEEGSGSVKWLSVDNAYKEYGLYTVVRYNPNDGSYRCVDTGEAIVVSTLGAVDVDLGDLVRFKEYEDQSEENIIAEEVWEDGTEYARGYYLDAHEIEIVQDNGYSNHGSISGAMSSRGIEKNKLMMGVGILLILVGVLGFPIFFANKEPIKKYLDKNTSYTYVTSVTSEVNHKQRAHVYRTSNTLDIAAKELMDKFYNAIESVQDNEEDGSIALLTDKEYCLLYKGEDDKFYIQVSSRKYTYTSGQYPYYARGSTRGFYRSYYYRNAYKRDYGRYKSDPNSYSNYTDDYNMGTGTKDYSGYVASVRQRSVNTRNSSGGGTSSGK
ncbi:MAG: DUF4178 domain-containing protein [Cellulosilyticaceae bacterium]